MQELELRGVEKSFGELPVLDGVSLKVNRGEFAAVVGPSGCGKSTVLRLFAGLEKPDGGQVLAGGREVEGPDRRRMLIFQDHALYPWRTVAENVGFGLELAGMTNAAGSERVREMLEKVGLAGFGDYYPSQLSGGMRQRASIARALVVDPDVLLLDEPYGALDALTRLQMQEELLRLWNGSGKTILLITHDIEEALYLADRIYVFSPRPARVVQVLEPDLPRPRQRGSLRFAELRREIMGALGLAVERRENHAEDAGADRRKRA